MSQKISNSLPSCDQLILNDQVWLGVQSVAESLEISVPELLEKISSQQLIVIEAEKLEDLLDTIDGLEGLLSAETEGTVSWQDIKAGLS
jgi:putative heme iron utilization protein